MVTDGRAVADGKSLPEGNVVCAALLEGAKEGRTVGVILGLVVGKEGRLVGVVLLLLRVDPFVAPVDPGCPGSTGSPLVKFAAKMLGNKSSNSITTFTGCSRFRLENPFRVPAVFSKHGTSWFLFEL